MKTRVIRSTVTASWSNLDPQNPPSDACKAAVQTAVHKEVPQSIRDDWSASAIAVAKDGSLPADALMAYAKGKIEALNAVRLAADPNAAEFAVVGDLPADCTYEYFDEVRVCYYNFTLTLGGAPWEVRDPSGGPTNPVLNLGLLWSMHT